MSPLFSLTGGTEKHRYGYIGEGSESESFNGTDEIQQPARNNKYYTGKLDEVRLWHTTRTQNEINDNRFVRLTGCEEDLILYYDFNEGGGTEIYDKARHTYSLFNGGIDWETGNGPIEDCASPTPDGNPLVVGLDGYRYGFNGQEKDDEVAGNGNSYTAEFWQYDSRLGRRWNLDPKRNPAISAYATFANNPIWYNDVKGDTIKVSTSFENDENAMARLDKWKESRAGKRFYERYDIGGKYENVSVEFDLYNSEDRSDSRTKSYGGFTQTFGVSKNSSRELNHKDKLGSNESLAFRIALNDASSDFMQNTDAAIRDGGLTILHETQHLRIINYGFLMTNTYQYSSSEQHYMMRTNLNTGAEYTQRGKLYKLPPNKIYDFNAERWQFLDENRFPGETNEQIERQIGGFSNQ